MTVGAGAPRCTISCAYLPAVGGQSRVCRQLGRGGRRCGSRVLVCEIHAGIGRAVAAAQRTRWHGGGHAGLDGFLHRWSLLGCTAMPADLLEDGLAGAIRPDFRRKRATGAFCGIRGIGLPCSAVRPRFAAVGGVAGGLPPEDRRCVVVAFVLGFRRGNCASCPVPSGGARNGRFWL